MNMGGISEKNQRTLNFQVKMTNRGLEKGRSLYHTNETNHFFITWHHLLCKVLSLSMFGAKKRLQE